MLTDETGTQVGATTYDPYGTTRQTTGETSRLGYAGEYTDPTTGLIYLRARWYDPTTGQFLTRDPLVATTQDPYSYAANDPVNYSDPLGLSKCGQLSFGGLIDCASKVDDVAAAGARNAASTGKVVAGVAGWAASEVAQPIVNGASNHLGVSGMICIGYCIGLEFQRGNPYLNYGGPGWIFGATAGGAYYTAPLDEWCDGGGVGGWGRFISASEDGNGKNRSFGIGGLGWLFGASDMETRPLGP